MSLTVTGKHIKVNVPVTPSPMTVEEGIPVPPGEKSENGGVVSAVRTMNQSPSTFRSSFKSGFLSIFYAIGDDPLNQWEKQVRSGYVRRVNDDEIGSLSLEMTGGTIETTFMTTPSSRSSQLSIRLPILVLILKNLRRPFMFQVLIVDRTGTRRRFIVSTFHGTPPSLGPFAATIPLRLEDGWNQLWMNLSDLTKKVYGTEYRETLRVQIHPNCRLRRVYFAERSYSEEEVPEDFKALSNMTSISTSTKKEEKVAKAKKEE